MWTLEHYRCIRVCSKLFPQSGKHLDRMVWCRVAVQYPWIWRIIWVGIWHDLSRKKNSSDIDSLWMSTNPVLSSHMSGVYSNSKRRIKSGSRCSASTWVCYSGVHIPFGNVVCFVCLNWKEMILFKGVLALQRTHHGRGHGESVRRLPVLRTSYWKRLLLWHVPGQWVSVHANEGSCALDGSG